MRVVDGGVMPMVPRAHTNVPIIALAERAADIIKEDWNNDSSDINKIRNEWRPFVPRRDIAR